MFAAQFEGTTSAAKAVTLTNEQNIPLNISSATIGGANSGDFGVTTTCPTTPSTLPATSPCALSVTFTRSGSGTYTLQVLGRFTNWQQGVTSLAFNQDITVNPCSINVIDSENLTATITVSPWAYVDIPYVPCGHVLTVTTGSEQESTAPIVDNFCVAQGAAQINSISTLSGAQGTTETVTITGGDTHFLQGVTTVSFGDPNFQVGQITVTSPTTLTVPVAVSTSATPGYKTVTVTTYGEVASQQYAFTVVPDVATLNEAYRTRLSRALLSLASRLSLSGS